MTPRITRADASDIPQLLALLQAMARESGGQIGSDHDRLLRHGFGPQPRFHALLARAPDDSPLGMVIYFAEYSTWRGQMGVFIQDVYVTPSGRGLGLGKRLLAEALRHADWQPEFLTLMVARDNTAARAFYAGLGLSPRDEADQLLLEGQGLAALLTDDHRL